VTAVVYKYDHEQTALHRYGLAILATAIALTIRRALGPMLHNNAPYLMLWPAIAFSAWYCGPGPGFAAMAIGVAGVWLWIVPNVPLFIDGAAVTNTGVGLAAFMVMSSIIIAMGALARRRESHERALAAEKSEATSKFKAVFNQSTVFAGILAVDGTVQEVNRLSLEVCGYRAEEVAGKPFWETPLWGNSNETRKTIREACENAANGKSFRRITSYWWADGSEHIADLSVHPIFDDQGRVFLIYPTGSDVTELKRIEDSYRRLAEALELQVRDRTQELEMRNTEVIEQAAMLRSLSQRLLMAQDEERRRVARELHDSAGQIVTALTLSLQAMRQNLDGLSPRVLNSVEDCDELLQQLSRDIRTMSYLLHPPMLDEIGLSAALQWYVSGLNERGGLTVSLSMPENLGRFARGLDLVLFRLIQECLTNVYRHSSSRTAMIRLDVKNGRVHLDVADEGRGIAPQKLREIQREGAGVGMQGMRERIRPFHGEMDVQSTPAGTTVKFAFPVPEGEPEADALATGVL
jgi:PAS domain S-box-containing protein